MTKKVEVIENSVINTFWRAIYENGESLSQIAPDGKENSYGDIDKRALTKFILYRYGEPIVVVHLDPNKKLIYRMRRAMDNHGAEETVYLVGWQENRNGMNIQMIVFLFEDDHIEVVDRFHEGHPWFYPVQFLEEEKI
jgi:hypothetical protein